MGRSIGPRWVAIVIGENAITLELHYAAGVRDRVHQLVRQEAECCSFLGFAVDESADPVSLTITATATHQTVLDRFASWPVTTGMTTRSAWKASGSAWRRSEARMATFSRRAVLQWDGGIPDGSGFVTPGSDAFTARAIFPSIAGDPPGKTTPEELLAASHATCYGIGLRALIARRGGRARRVSVTATVTAEKGPQGIRVQASHLTGIVDGLQGIEESALQELARETEERCTISIAIRGTVSVSSEVRASP